MQRSTESIGTGQVSFYRGCERDEQLLRHPAAQHHSDTRSSRLAERHMILSLIQTDISSEGVEVLSHSMVSLQLRAGENE